MLKLFKNLKVGTKLFAILAAPAAVLLVLAFIGASERIDTASEASEVEELTAFAGVTADVIEEIHLEQLAAARYLAHDGHQQDEGDRDDETQAEIASLWSDVEDRQVATDEAVARFEAEADGIGAIGEHEEVESAVANARTRLDTGLDVNRRSVEQIQSEPVSALGPYWDLSGDLNEVNQAISRAADNPELARGLASFVNLSQY